jgi:DNA-binding transcriptional ArsR family regulator
VYARVRTALRAGRFPLIYGGQVDIFRKRNMIRSVPRAATTSDVFNAVAESRRRDILVYLASRERPVGDIVSTLGLGQPSVSKHLKVLLSVGLVEVRRDGRQVFYRTNVAALKPLSDWTRYFERFWQHQLARVKARAEGTADPRSGR